MKNERKSVLIISYIYLEEKIYQKKQIKKGENLMYLDYWVCVSCKK